jgi:hypothetical protein
MPCLPRSTRFSRREDRLPPAGPKAGSSGVRVTGSCGPPRCGMVRDLACAGRLKTPQPDRCHGQQSRKDRQEEHARPHLTAPGVLPSHPAGRHRPQHSASRVEGTDPPQLSYGPQGRGVITLRRHAGPSTLIGAIHDNVDELSPPSPARAGRESVPAPATCRGWGSRAGALVRWSCLRVHSRVLAGDRPWSEEEHDGRPARVRAHRVRRSLVRAMRPPGLRSTAQKPPVAGARP